LNFLRQFIENVKDMIMSSLIGDSLDEEPSLKGEELAAFNEESLKLIKSTPFEEKFAMSLAAPFRDLFINTDTYSSGIRKSRKKYDAIYPLHLYILDGGVKTKRELNSRKKCLKALFNVETPEELISCIAINSEKALQMAGRSDARIRSPFKESFSRRLEGVKIDPQRRKSASTLFSFTAFAATLGYDARYLDKEESMQLLKNINLAVRSMYSYSESWFDFSQGFLEKESMSMILHYPSFRRHLARTMNYLLHSSVSPWNNIQFYVPKVIENESKLFAGKKRRPH
jgi:hypothetical protein